MATIGSTRLGYNVKTLETSPAFAGYSKVVIQIDDDGNAYVAGNDAGRTLTLFTPWGTQEMANNILYRLEGFTYQPYEAVGAILNPAAELGDAVAIKDTYSGIYKRELNFTSLHTATISAPQDEDIDHEYPYASSDDRKTARMFKTLSAEFDSRLTIATNAIAAEVEKKADSEGGARSSFGWKLDEDSFDLFSNGETVLHADKDGIEVSGNGLFEGEIRASNGTIGGFTIGEYSLHSGEHDTLLSTATGVYLGNDGISVGDGFRVSSSGYVQAKGMTINGVTITGNNNLSGGVFSGGSFGGGSFGGSFSGFGALTGDSTVNGTKMDLYVNNLIANKITADYITSRIQNANLGTFNSITIGAGGSLNINASATFKGRACSWKTVTISGKTIHYLGY